jgi:hypothetical protein
MSKITLCDGSIINIGNCCKCGIYGELNEDTKLCMECFEWGLTMAIHDTYKIGIWSDGKCDIK